MRKTATILGLLLFWLPTTASAEAIDSLALGAARGVAGIAASESTAKAQGVPSSQESTDGIVAEESLPKSGRAGLEDDL